MIRRLVLIAAAIFCGSVLTGCTTGSDIARLEDPSDVPEAPETMAFPGILTASTTAENPSVQYLFQTHGMGMTDPDAVLIRPVALALRQAGYRLEPRHGEGDWLPAPTARPHRFRIEAVNCSGPDAASPPCTYTSFGAYRVDRYIHADGARRVVVFSYLWHEDLWKVQEPFLAHDRTGLRNGFAGWTSGLLSGGLKDRLVNEGLSDVAAYLGPAGEALRQGMSSAVCTMLRDAAGVSRPENISSSPAKCLTTEEAQRLEASGARFSFISHSLGSRMLFDVLGADDSSDRPPPAALAALGSSTDTFFMAANQLSLLGISRGVKEIKNSPSSPTAQEEAVRKTLTEGCPSNLPSFLTIRCRTAALKGAETSQALAGPTERRPLWVIGFFDPGDVLGYSVMGWRTPEGPGQVRLISVLHRNTPQILWLGSIPTSAHDTELALRRPAGARSKLPGSHDAPPRQEVVEREVFRNPNAAGMIFCGALSYGAGQLKPDSCPGS